MSDYIVKNAKVYTQDSSRPWAEAFAVRDGRFECVGTNEEVEAWAAAQDADGRTDSGRFLS